MDKRERLKLQIRHATEAVGKSYQFDDDHDDTKPIGYWFQETHEGLVLFVVFYTLACRYSACLGCNLPATSALHFVDYRDVMRQVDRLFADPKVTGQADRVCKVILSNQGSVLDEETFSSTALMYFVAKLNLHLPNLTILSLETRPEYIDAAELEFLARAIRETHQPEGVVEIAIGFEVFDDDLRNRVFRKGLSLGSFERVVKLVSHHGFMLKCYFMQKPIPGMTDEEAVLDIQNGIAYLHDISRENKVPINMHLNPTYVARGTQLAKAFEKGEYRQPNLTDVAAAVLAAKDTVISVYVGLNDEGLAVEGGSFVGEGDELLVEKLEEFNSTQDFSILEEIVKNR